MDIRTRVLELASSTASIPSARTVKNRSGRQSRKQANARRTMQRVGGFSSDFQAITAPADAALCNVVPRETGMRNGKPFRSPARHFRDIV